MKAIVWTGYGSPDVLLLKEVPKPLPRADEVLVKVYATTVSAGDCELRSLKGPILFGLFWRFYMGLIKPRRITVLGQELAGEIEAVGKDVTTFKEGDQVYGLAGLSLGTYAEYVCWPAARNGMGGLLASKPANMSYEEAAAVPLGGPEALLFLRKADIQPGEKVLIDGAGGSVGTFAVQLAKAAGAEVTAVDRAGKLDMLRAIGADRVIDFTQEDFTKSSDSYDVIFDVAGKAPFSRSIRSLKTNGRFLLGNPRPAQMLQGQWTPARDGKRVISRGTSRRFDDLMAIKQLIEAGKIKSVIDRRYPLEQVAEAHRYVETGQKKGCVVIKVGHDG